MNNATQILITGPESSGKTTLALDISAQFDIHLIEDYSRTYLTYNSGVYVKADILKMARSHKELLIKNNDKSLVLDTYLLNYFIWSTHKYGDCDPWIKCELEAYIPTLVLLVEPNLPWIYDPLRESAHERYVLFEKYKKYCHDLNWPTYIINADGPHRKDQAISIIKELKIQL